MPTAVDLSPTSLIRSGDRKVTNSVTPGGSARGKNAFGLPSGSAFSCPGATSFCERVCYAGKLEKIYIGVKTILMHNWNLLRDADVTTMYSLLFAMVQDFVVEADSLNAKGKPATYVFRIHWDGDYFSVDYAIAWKNVMLAFPDVRFWSYTRSFTSDLNVVPILAGIPNHTLYLSADGINARLANEVSEANPGVFIARLSDTFAEARAEMPEGKTYNCPENDRRIPLIDAKGSACVRCGVCVAGRGNIAFAVKKK